MGLQIPCGVHSEVPQEDDPRTVEASDLSDPAKPVWAAGIDLVEGHAIPNHIHLCLKIPPKDSVSNTVGFLIGRSAVRIHRELLHERRMTGPHFRAVCY